MIEAATDEAMLQAERSRLQVVLKDLQRMQRSSIGASPVDEPPGRSPIDYVSVSFLQTVDWQQVDEVPGPAGASQFDFRLAPLQQRVTAAPNAPSAESLANDAGLPEPPIDRVGGFFENFDLQDPVDEATDEPATEECETRTAENGLGFEPLENGLPAEPEARNDAADAGGAQPEERNEPTVASAAFSGFNWD